MPPLSVMFKTVSSDCNLDCGYCYYRESLYGGRGRDRHRISLDLLKKLIPEYMDYVADSHVASFAWQGGEPTLAGLDFFRQAVALQARYARPPMTVSNSIQTNGLIVDEGWAAFFREFDFLVGVSLDGPRSIHDSVRLDAAGRGSFDRVIAGVHRLKAANVAVNVLSVVGPHNVDDPASLLDFYRSEGLEYVQFIPCMDFQGDDPSKPPDFTVSAAQYGRFLSGLFDAWYNDGFPLVSVRLFDNFLQTYLGLPNESCVHASRCDSALIIEYNGDVFPCDFYVDESWRLGNVMTASIGDLAANPRRLEFADRKRPLPAACLVCRHQEICRGGCPRNRRVLGDRSSGEDVLCDAYRTLLDGADSRFKSLAAKMVARRRYLDIVHQPGGPRPNRNDQCPCGSGRRLRQCCEHPSLSRSYVFRPDS